MNSRSDLPKRNGVAVFKHDKIEGKWIARATFAYECAVMCRDGDGSLTLYDSELEALYDVTRRYMAVLNARQQVHPKRWAKASDMLKELSAGWRVQKVKPKSAKDIAEELFKGLD